MSATHGPVWALVLSVVFSCSSLPSQGTSAVHCDKNILCVNGKCVIVSDEKKLPHCECDALWFGASCSEFICDHNKTNPCRNGAKCRPLDKYTDYQCLCDNSHSGKHCEVSNFNCTSMSCRKHGKCSDDSSRLSGYRCDCDTGFTGADCETNINDCEGVDCNNGSCVDGINDYICNCSTNYTGRHCDHPDYCAIHSAEQSHGCIDGVCCANNGTCYNNLTKGRHECNCTPEWLPTFGCRREYDPCGDHPCKNGGTCENNGIDYICHCVPPYTGPNCATQLTNCTNNTCLNNGTCIAEVTSELDVIGEHCECPPYYTGELCQTHFDPCCADKCQNNGTCKSSYVGNGEYKTTCSCTEYFTGENCTKCKFGYAGDKCEIDLDLCENSPCHNGGTCEDHGSKFACQCPPGYSGHDCSYDNNTCGINECLDNNGSCSHICINTEGSYYCECPTGYLLQPDNHNCTDINECLDNNGMCSHICDNTEGSYHCACPSGYDLQPDNHTCSDINECLDNDGGCSHTCNNVVGSYYCKCPTGYVLQPNQHDCEDTNECLSDNGGCDHICTNTQGSFECSCNISYIRTADKKTCGWCDYMLEETSGRINTTGFSNSPYAPISNCRWIIDLPAYKSIELKFDEIDIEESPNCVKDRVTILNGKGEDTLPLGSYCGNKLPPTKIQSSTEIVTIQFVSDGTVNNKGFSLQYRGLKERSRGKYGCALLPNSNTKFGLSTFPSKYTGRVDCVYYLLSRRQRVKLTFLYLDIVNANCSQDRIEIYDGFTARAPTIMICNGNKVVEFTSNGKNIKMIYTGRSSDKYRGFHAVVKFI